MPIKVAAVDFVPAWGDLENNISRLASAVEETARQGIDYAVFPETAVSGYIFTDFAEMSPYLDTIPGRTTQALLPILARTGLHMSVGIAERDAQTGLAYNSAVLLGPSGIIGVYRKNGLNSQDQKIFSPGDTGVKVFETPVGRIALLICYDDTYWQYARLAALRGAQIIGWHSVSDRLMPDTPPAQKKGDHSTVSNVQYMSAQNGVCVIAATRSGIETNPLSGAQVYYNGGSSIWSAQGHRLAQAPVVPPVEIAPGLNHIITATVDLAEVDEVRKARLALRRPAVYHPLLALHRSPTDANATTQEKPVQLVASQWPEGASRLDMTVLTLGALHVLPALSALPSGLTDAEIIAHAEPAGGPTETALVRLSAAGGGHVVGSYPERDGQNVFHTIVLAGPEGKVLGRYRVIHPAATASAGWAQAGDEPVVVSTPLGRIALACAEELAIPETGALYCTLRADILAAPAQLPMAVQVEMDPALFTAHTPPTGRANIAPYAAAHLNQLWVVCGGRRKDGQTAAAIYGPEPVVFTPTLTAQEGQDDVRHETAIPFPGTWINQQQLIAGQQTQYFVPLVLDKQNAAFRRWQENAAS